MNKAVEARSRLLEVQLFHCQLVSNDENSDYHGSLFCLYSPGI